MTQAMLSKDVLVPIIETELVKPLGERDFDWDDIPEYQAQFLGTMSGIIPGTVFQQLQSEIIELFKKECEKGLSDYGVEKLEKTLMVSLINSGQLMENGEVATKQAIAAIGFCVNLASLAMSTK